MSNFPLYDLRGVGKEYPGPSGTIQILKDLNLRVEEGESVAVVGASGAGKSTLLHVLGTLDTATSGEVFFRGENLNVFGEEARARLRNKEIGFVFQFHHLLPEFTTLENIAMPGLIAGMSKAKALARASEVLDLTGLSQRSSHKVTTLSGGERQRAAIARAIMLKPQVLLADEPTGNLDEKTGERIARLLFDLNEELGMAMVVVTHNVELARQMGRRFELRSGELYEQTC
ncbi:ABC transporter ATP-binding protein [Desulfovibrio ferrophilus]|uniref:ABC transporter ATP-binding protein n=1 Tax=Desulfovibrio ferrophilus TaxID=241368 RepID=A0A2Z6AUZ4_9BACT|nr:ABC transporter ATP-binding protein [Desulfovibrio ferrophilus]BBD07054.1 ABC transporter ATP-binding protein [Desulfovibrio ferrophilus]